MPSSIKLLGFLEARLAENLAFVGLAVVDAAGLLGKALADVLEVLLHVLAHLAQHGHHHRRLGVIGHLCRSDR